MVDLDASSLEVQLSALKSLHFYFVQEKGPSFPLPTEEIYALTCIRLTKYLKSSQKSVETQV
jgi:hypothetical protein